MPQLIPGMFRVTKFWDVQGDKVLLNCRTASGLFWAQGVSKSCGCFTRVFVVHGKGTVQVLFFSLLFVLELLLS